MASFEPRGVAALLDSHTAGTPESFSGFRATLDRHAPPRPSLLRTLRGVERSRVRPSRALRQSHSDRLVRRPRSARVRRTLLDLPDLLGALRPADVHGRVFVHG